MNILGTYLLEDLILDSHDLVTSFVQLYYGIMENEQFTQSDNVKFCPHLLVFCGLVVDRDVGTKASVLAQRIIQTMNVKKKFAVYKDLLNIDCIEAFKAVSIPKPKWFTMFFSIITENIKHDCDISSIQGLCMKSTEELTGLVVPMFFKTIESGEIELSATYLGFFRVIVNIITSSKACSAFPSGKHIIREFRNLAEKSEDKLNLVEGSVSEDQLHEVDILKFNLKNLRSDLAVA